jgi:hypothetical protein
VAILCVAYPVAFFAVISTIVWPDNDDEREVPMSELLLRALIGVYMVSTAVCIILLLIKLLNL